MRIQDTLRMRLRSLFGRPQADTDLDEELQYHLHREIDVYIASGMSREEARRQALLSMGGMEQRKAQCRDARGLNFLDNLRADIRFALRQLRKSPGFTCAAVLILSLGTGASVAVFGLVDAALIQPLPYRDTSRLVAVYETVEIIPRSNLSYPDYVDWKQQNTTLEALDLYNRTNYVMSTSEGGRPLRGARVTNGFFRTLGVTPLLGRDFQPGEDSPKGPLVAMLSHGTWLDKFGGRKDILGQPVTLNGEVMTIIGVLPPDFHFAPTGLTEVWTALQPVAGCDIRRGCHSVYGIGRLKEGVSVATADANLKSIAKALEIQYPDTNRGQGAEAIPLSEAIVGDIRPIVLLLLSGAVLLVAIASVNVASLVLVRSDSRKREFAVRSALGASAGRLVSQFITEGSLLVACGGVVGLVAGSWGMQLLVRLIPENMSRRMPFLQHVAVNERVLAFAAAIAVFALILFSFTPALRLTLSQIREGLAESGRGTAGLTWRRVGSRMVVVELAIAMVLLVAAGLLGKSLQRLMQVDLGFRPDRLAAMEVAAPLLGRESNEKQLAFGRELLRRVADTPGVQSAALASMLPLQGNGNTVWIRMEGRPYNGEHNEVNQRKVSATFFATIGATLARGRYFTEADNASTRKVVVINQKLVDKYFAGEDPIGKRIGDTSLSRESMREIVGVVDDIREANLDQEIWPAVYYPFNQEPASYFAVIARTTVREESLLAPIATAARSLGPDVITMPGSSMNDRIAVSEPAYIRRSSASLVSVFAGLAFLMSIVGLYGVVAYSVSQRTREIGVRMALGAGQGSVARMVMREAIVLTLLGTGLGIACAIGAASMIRKMLFEVAPWDAPTLAVVAVSLALAALLASYIPARRAAAVNPVVALRAD